MQMHGVHRVDIVLFITNNKLIGKKVSKYSKYKGTTLSHIILNVEQIHDI